MKKQRRRACILLLTTTVMLLSGCQIAVKNGGTLKVGVRDSVPGFGYFNPVSETYSGMEVELARNLANALGYQDAELVSVTAQTREQALEDGAVDCVVATFTITDERKQQFDFSLPYYTDHLKVMVENSSLIQKLDDLDGMCVGVSEGSTSAEYLEKEMASHGSVTFAEYPTYPELIDALETGAVDAVCTDSSILKGYQNDERSLLEDSLAEQQFGIATKKGAPLSAKIQAQMEVWRADGTLDELNARWN